MSDITINGNGNQTAGRDLVIYYNGFIDDIETLLKMRERMLFRLNSFNAKRWEIREKSENNVMRKMPSILLGLGFITGTLQMAQVLPTDSIIAAILFLVASGLAHKHQPEIFKADINAHNYYLERAEKQAEQIEVIDLDIQFLKSK